jgi:hypothetical protein
VAGYASVRASAGGQEIYFDVYVTPGQVAAYRIAPVGPVAPGAPITLSITPVDAYGNHFPTFPGGASSVQVAFTSSDPRAVLPGPIDLAYPPDPSTESYKPTVLVPGFVLNTTGPQTITLTEQDGSSITAAVTVAVTNVAPTQPSLSMPSQVRPNQTFTLGGSFSDSGGVDQIHHVHVTWADGSTSTLDLPAGTFTFSVDHVYTFSAPPTTLPVSVVVTDALGAASPTASRSIKVSAGLVAGYRIGRSSQARRSR